MKFLMTLPAVLLVWTLIPGATAVSATYTVSPGQSIQEAIDKAGSGDTVQVLPGAYNESLTIATAGVTVKGFEYEGERTVLNGAGELERAVLITADGVTLDELIITGFTGEAVSVQEANDVTLRHLLIIHQGTSGIAARDSQTLTIRYCVVGEGPRTAIEFERCTGPVLRNSECYGAGTGLRLVDCLQARIENNTIHRNGSGVVVRGTSTESNEPGSYGRLAYNRIWGNGHGIEIERADLFPPGFGIVVEGADHTEIARNYIADNGAYGIAVLSADFEAVKDAIPSETEAPVNTDHVYVHHNRYRNNGSDPSKAFREAFPEIPAGDLYWDRTGIRNQWQEAGELKTWPEKLIAEQGGVHTEVIHFL